MAEGPIAIIGAGLAGAACARALREAGRDAVLFDKGRGAGGRLSTRQAETPSGTACIDHGAQFLAARGEAFTALMEEARAAGSAAPWEGRLVSIDRAGNVEPLREETRWTGTPGMNAIVKTALSGFEVRFGARATKLKGGPGRWRVVLEEGGEEGPFAAIAVTIPPEQMIDLFARSNADFAEQIAEAKEAVLGPCQAVMLQCDPGFDPGFDAAKLYGGGVTWMARTLSKPGRNGAESWVLHASTNWSRVHLEDSPEAVIRALTEEVHVRFGMPLPGWAAAHRWRYALSEKSPGTPFALDETGTVGCGGDWRLGGRAELAWDSGLALGEVLARA